MSKLTYGGAMSGFIRKRGAWSKAGAFKSQGARLERGSCHEAPFPVPWDLREVKRIGRARQARSDAAVERARKRLEARARAEGFWSLKAAWRAGDER